MEEINCLEGLRRYELLDDRGIGEICGERSYALGVLSWDGRFRDVGYCEMDRG